jgi:hypothetical protein
MRVCLVQLLKIFHDWLALAYLGANSMFSHGWYEALEHAPPPVEKNVCPVKQLIGISGNE